MKFDLHRPVLDEETHKYSLPADPDLPLTSVTQVIKAFSREFDADGHAAKYAYDHGMAVTDVLSMWRAEADRASRVGNYVHEAAELAVNDINNYSCFHRAKWDCAESTPFINAAYDYLGENIDMCYGWAEAELRLCYPDYGIAGTVDLLHGGFGLAAMKDWKTSKRMDVFGYSTNLYSPLNRLPESNYWKYVCQMNIYRFILAEVHGLLVDTLDIVWLLPNGTAKEVYVPIFEFDLVRDVLVKFHKKEAKK